MAEAAVATSNVRHEDDDKEEMPTTEVNATVTMECQHNRIESLQAALSRLQHGDDALYGPPKLSPNLECEFGRLEEELQHVSDCFAAVAGVGEAEKRTGKGLQTSNSAPRKSVSPGLPAGMHQRAFVAMRHQVTQRQRATSTSAQRKSIHSDVQLTTDGSAIPFSSADALPTSAVEGVVRHRPSFYTAAFRGVTREQAVPVKLQFSNQIDTHSPLRTSQGFESKAVSNSPASNLRVPASNSRTTGPITMSMSDLQRWQYELDSIRSKLIDDAHHLIERERHLGIESRRVTERKQALTIRETELKHREAELQAREKACDEIMKKAMHRCENDRRVVAVTEKLAQQRTAR